jgi:hypothetical protein
VSLKNIKGNLYYYESVREGGRVRSEYVSAGRFALLADALARARRANREAERAEARRRLDEVRAAAAEAERGERGAFDAVERLFRGAMARAGFHRPGRHPWRRRRMGTAVKATGKGKAKAVPAPAAAAAADRPPARTEGQRLVDAVEDGVPGALDAFKAWLESPRGAYAVKVVGSPQYGAAEAVIAEYDAAFDPRGPSRVAANKHWCKVREQLLGKHPTPLESLLVERVVFTWFCLYTAELKAARLWVGRAPDPGLARLHERRVAGASRRFTAACKALADLRRLPVPPGVVNVVLAGGGAAAAPPGPVPLEAP